jgi:hypothetical protein
VEHVQNSDRRNYRVSFDKIRNRVGFECTTTIDDGIRELKDAFDRDLIQDYKDAQYSNVQFLRQAGQLASSDDVSSRVMAALAEDPAH